MIYGKAAYTTHRDGGMCWEEAIDKHKAKIIATALRRHLLLASGPDISRPKKQTTRILCVSDGNDALAAVNDARIPRSPVVAPQLPQISRFASYLFI
jgi:hypothetical protein